MYQWMLAIRYLLRRPITWLAVLAVALSVAVALVVLTVMHGLVGDYKARTHALVGDAVLAAPSLVGFPCEPDLLARLEALPEVDAVAPVVSTVALVRRPGRSRTQAVRLVGVDPEAMSRVGGWASFLQVHGPRPQDCFRPPSEPNAEGFIAGIDMVLSKDSDGRYLVPRTLPPLKLEVITFPLTAKGAPARAGMGEVNSRVFTLSDLCWTGLAREDYGTLYVHWRQAQWLAGMNDAVGRVSALHLRFAGDVAPLQAMEAVDRLWQTACRQAADPLGRSLMQAVRLQSWQRYRRDQIAAMEKEEVMVSVMFLMVGLTTGFVVFVVFTMIVGHKSRDIGILKSVGVSDAAVLTLFVRFGLLVGILGVGLGGLAGWGFLRGVNPLEDWLYARFGWQLWNRALYAIGDIPNRVTPAVFGRIGLVALLVCLLGAIGPAWKAARRAPVTTLTVTGL